jgi:hypothetical protein
MTIEGPHHEHTKPLTDEPCPPTGRATVPGVRFIHRAMPLPVFEDALHAATIARHAIAAILQEQAATCERHAEPFELNGPVGAEPGDFVREFIAFLGVAWTDFEYRHTLKPMHPRNALHGALVIPWWAAAQPMVGEAAIQRGVPIIAAMWDAPPETTEPTDLPAGRVLALHSRAHMPPSLLEQNYDVEGVYPFTTRKASA